MEITYTMITTDGQQYGPVTAEQFKAWIAEGRIQPDTKVMRSDVRSWLPAAQYPELGLAPTAPVSSPPALPGGVSPTVRPAVSTGLPATIDSQTAFRARSGARWFYWIAAFSVINTVITASSGSFFLVGLGVSLFLPVSLGIAAAALLGLLGYFASKNQSWAFIVGMVLYALDAAIFLFVQEWLGLAFHAYVLFRLFIGLKSNLELNSAGNRGSV